MSSNHNNPNQPKVEKTPAELQALRQEIIDVLGYNFKYEAKDFTVDEDIVVKQVKSSIAGQGSAAFHSFLKESGKERDRLRLMQEEWDEAVALLEQHKAKIVADALIEAEAAKKREKNTKRKKQKKNKKSKKGGVDGSSDDDDDDDDFLVSLFTGQVSTPTEGTLAEPQKATNIETKVTEPLNSTIGDTTLPDTASQADGLQKRKAETQFDSVPAEGATGTTTKTN